MGVVALEIQRTPGLQADVIQIAPMGHAVLKCRCLLNRQAGADGERLDLRDHSPDFEQRWIAQTGKEKAEIQHAFRKNIHGVQKTTVHGIRPVVGALWRDLAHDEKIFALPGDRDSLGRGRRSDSALQVRAIPDEDPHAGCWHFSSLHNRDTAAGRLFDEHLQSPGCGRLRVLRLSALVQGFQRFVRNDDRDVVFFKIDHQCRLTGLWRLTEICCIAGFRIADIKG